MKSRPNILFIQADQLAASVLSAYGHKLVKTPHLDRIAARGAVFENAYTPNPICASSRFAMMSGQYSSRIGAFDNASEFPAQFQPLRITCAPWAMPPACRARCILWAPINCMALKSA
ncbi:MAG: hypothetical protein EBQ58_09035 [Betaproteobacteria bacterium]|nr:hypothetical protein [Betaproteobacteria bacterium]